MINKNFLKFKKVSEERYFKTYNELFNFVLKSENLTEETFYDLSAKRQSYKHELLIPLVSKDTHRLVNVGGFICNLTKGNFNRKSGNYKYNLLAIQKSNNLTGNDRKKLFNY